MGLASPTTAGLTVLFGVIVFYSLSYLRSKNEKPLPPGPKGIALLGNVSDMPPPGTLECHHWLKHKDIYGPISSVTILGTTFVIINDAQMAFELLSNRSATHSSRPHQVFSCDMVGWNNSLAMSPYADSFKMHRKNIAKVASSNVALSVFDRIQEVEAAHFLLNMLESPEALFDHIRMEAGAVILKIAYGYTTKRGTDPLVDMAGKTMEEFAECTVPGRFMVDLMPFLKYVPEWCPGTGFKAKARKMAAQLERTSNQPYQFVKKQMRENTHKTSFLSQAIEKIGMDKELEFIHKWSAASLYLGGADTTVSSLMTFFLAMTVCPEVQVKAQEELDRVVGRGRLPVRSDLENLPYIVAIMKETHRWHPVAPMGLPHCSTAEDVFEGYRIPKGSLVIANIWWFTHDPAVYADPMVFRPERHLDTPTHKAEPDPRNWIFGFGRRVCPGRYVADNALFITIAQTLAVFNIEKFSENGKVVEPEVKFEPGIVSHPKPYRAIVKPRSAEHAELIKKAEQDFPWEESDAKELEKATV
ncbi:cytochrome P450 [Dothidotthia symphoricarpi CBS 119687]|uniref:Cytochrome P450 n=1 Tax=Dothidotthia symphoricarpi CBS 119687 TaxID=1392245 RepID=A0A6A5ZZL3_9PLEO|nr:cytochrome P450 [Dothidotthia symphoricarpi CBS 119687]KAF2124167.1 cytochrome P450 [Dothidotthia symphoricarpi CBS 119687]